MKDISIRLVGFMFFLVLGFVFYQTVIQKENEKKNYPYKLKIFYPTA
jgi:cytochrome c oxidase assembly factor CtaG